MKALITGGAGFIGGHLAEALVARGDSVVVIDDLSTGCKENLDAIAGGSQCELIVDTVLNAEGVSKHVAECDCIFHLASACKQPPNIASPC